MEVELPHDPDKMILNGPDEPRQHNQSHVMSVEDDSERFNSRWDDVPSYRILGQLCQLLVLLANALNSSSMAATAVGLEG